MRFLDDYTPKSEIILITNKNDVPAEFKRYLAYNEKLEFWSHCVKLYDSGENNTLLVRESLADWGIVVQIKTTEQHHQNNAPESLNCDLIDRLHRTLLLTKLDLKWWPEVLTTVNYLRNLSLSSVIDQTSYEEWYSEMPDLAHLCAISRIAYAKKTDRYRKKLNNTKGIACKLIRYDGDRIHWLLKLDNHIIGFTNVAFNEKGPYLVGSLSEKGNSIYTQGKSAINLNRAVVVEHEQVSNNKVCTSEARSDNKSSIGKNDLFELELPFMSTERNTLNINTSKNKPSSSPKSFQLTGKSQVQRASERWNQDQHPNC